MERATQIPEILDVIFSHNQQSQNARCARVSRLWSDVALDHVWRKDPPLCTLLQLLAPLVPSDNLPQTKRSTVVFSRPIKSKDWIRFFGLACRVREFTLTKVGMNGIMDSVFMGVSMTRPTVSILPCLEKLSISGRLAVSQIQYSCLFLHGFITSFSFTIWDHPDMAEEVQSLLNLVLQRSPGLTRLDLSFGELGFQEIETDLCLLLSGLRQLESLRLCPALFSASVSNAIASLPNLTDVDINPDIYSSGGGHIDFLLPDGDSVFQSLTCLAMRGDLNTVTRLFSPRVFPLRLCTLKIEIIDENRASDFRPCLEALANACPELRKLEFSINDAMPEPPNSGPIMAQDLAPLTSFPLLETFGLRFDRPVSMSDEELIHTVKGCPSLRHLDLNCSPLSATTESTSLTLGFLALVAKESATIKLERLSVYVNALSTDDLPEVEGYLENLRYISFGVSPICEPSDAVLLYLSRLIPETCAFGGDVGIDPDEMWEDEDEISDRRHIWGDIKRILYLFRKMRLKERMRAEVRQKIAPSYGQ